MGDVLSNETPILESTFFMFENEPFNHVLIFPYIFFAKSLFVCLFVRSLTAKNLEISLFSTCGFKEAIFVMKVSPIMLLGVEVFHLTFRIMNIGTNCNVPGVYLVIFSRCRTSRKHDQLETTNNLPFTLTIRSRAESWKPEFIYVIQSPRGRIGVKK